MHCTIELVDRLIERDFVRRRRDEGDQRRVIVDLTARGEEILRKLSLAHRAELQSTGPTLVEALNALFTQSTDQLVYFRDESVE